ncbi:hypothetical protein MHU86_2338 [Fragilaria crotonensis]|nr:hypothetical protein MHU86_2338 [Fragilaria crotonensis]
MSVFEESNHEDDFVILTVDIDDCPIAELPLTEIYDVSTSLLKDDYLDTLRKYITQQLEDTAWLEDQSVSPLFDAGFATFHRRANGDILSLRKPARFSALSDRHCAVAQVLWNRYRSPSSSDSWCQKQDYRLERIDRPPYHPWLVGELRV